MKIFSFVVSLFFSAFGFANEEPVMLWSGFDTSMSAQDVLLKTQGLRDTSGPGKEKIGLEITYSKKDEKVTSLGYLTAYCSMTADRRLRIKGELATIKWCFNSGVDAGARRKRLEHPFLYEKSKGSAHQFCHYFNESSELIQFKKMLEQDLEYA